MLLNYLLSNEEERNTTSWRCYQLLRDEAKREKIRALKERPPKFRYICEYMAAIKEADFDKASEIAKEFKEKWKSDINKQVNN